MRIRARRGKAGRQWPVPPWPTSLPGSAGDWTAGRVRAEDAEIEDHRRLLDRALAPLNRLSSKRFLREARRQVWHNMGELHAARLLGQDAYRARLAEPEVLSAARVADLLAPGQVLPRLAVAGFGVVLPPPGQPLSGAPGAAAAGKDHQHPAAAQAGQRLPGPGGRDDPDRGQEVGLG